MRAGYSLFVMPEVETVVGRSSYNANHQGLTLAGRRIDVGDSATILQS